jgi:hypothetical protein
VTTVASAAALTYSGNGGGNETDSDSSSDRSSVNHRRRRRTGQSAPKPWRIVTSDRTFTFSSQEHPFVRRFTIAPSEDAPPSLTGGKVVAGEYYIVISEVQQ